MSGKHGDKQASGSGTAPAQIRVGMESSGEKADGGENEEIRAILNNKKNGGENAALRALVQKLPNLSYMLSDSLVVPSRTR